MAGSRANWEEQTGGEKRMSSFERSKRDREIAVKENAARKAAYSTEKKESTPSKQAPAIVGKGLVRDAINRILSKNADTKRRIDENF